MKHRRHRFEKNAFNKNKSSVFTGQKRSLTVTSAFVQLSSNFRPKMKRFFLIFKIFVLGNKF